MRSNVWTVAKLDRLAEMKKAGAVGSAIANELGKTAQQVHNKWAYIERFGLERAKQNADDYGQIPKPSSNGHAREPDEELANEHVSLADIKATVHFIRAAGSSERA